MMTELLSEEGERKGTNKYYPPDYDPKKGGLNSFMGTHALRERARKLHLGILIIRFELPYNIWCDGCGNHVGMGVRYNAEKTKVGMYYSTPVYQFRMKCHLCDSHFEMKTDPGNLDYIIVSGARRQENRWDPTENGQVVPDDKRVIRQLADDAMFKLQHGVEDQSKLKSVTPTLGKLEDLQERWKDDYSSNKALRAIFRTRKREIKAEEDKDNEFLKKRSLDIPLLKESEEDAKIASLIRLQPSQSSEERQKQKLLEIDRKSNFPFPLPSIGSFETDSNNSSGILASTTSTDIHQGTSSILGNSRSLLLQNKRSSLGITFSKKGNYVEKSVGISRPKLYESSGLSYESNAAVDQDHDHKVEIFSNNGAPESSNSSAGLVVNSLKSTLSTDNDNKLSHSGKRDESQKQWNTNKLWEGTSVCGVENSGKPTTRIQPKAIISSTLILQSRDIQDTESGKGCEITESSTHSSAIQLPSHQSSVPSALSLISGGYGSSSSSSEDD